MANEIGQVLLDLRQALAARQAEADAQGSLGRRRDREFYSVAQVAAMFGMSAMTIYRAIDAKEFPALKVRGRWIIPGLVIDSMIEALLTNGAPADAAWWVQQAGGAA